MAGAAQLERLLGSRDTYKEQTSLFLRLVGVVARSGVRQDVLLDGNDKHVWKLESLCGVQCHQGDSVVVGQIVGVGRQADLFEELLQSGPVFIVLIDFGRIGQKFLHVAFDTLVGGL